MLRLKGLLSVLLDPHADIGLRDDAAMDLHSFDTPEVEAALAITACDQAEHEIIRASCGESLAEIWLRRGTVNTDILSKLFGVARAEAVALLRARGIEV